LQGPAHYVQPLIPSCGPGWDATKRLQPWQEVRWGRRASRCTRVPARPDTSRRRFP
jgi:hypothetical protein